MVRKGVQAIEIALARLAGNQHGVISFQQLLALGLSADAIQKRVSRGRLHRVHRGVYAVGHASLTNEGRWIAAVLACPRAVEASRGPLRPAAGR